jgi:hypothetical protein
MRSEEREYLIEMKLKSGRSWLELIYRGLGLKREDYLNSRKIKDAVTDCHNESQPLSQS